MYSCISRIAVSVRCLKKSFSANSLARSALESPLGSENPFGLAQVEKRGGGTLQTGQIRVHRLENEENDLSDQTNPCPQVGKREGDPL